MKPPHENFLRMPLEVIQINGVMAQNEALFRAKHKVQTLRSELGWLLIF